MDILFSVLIIFLFLLSLALYFLTSRSSLAKETLKNSETMTTTFSKLDANGIDCIKYLQSTIPHKPFKLVKKERSVGARFFIINRRLEFGKSLENNTAESIIDGAHEFAHILQSQSYWALLSVLKIGSIIPLLAIVPAIFIWGLSSHTITLAFICFIMSTAGNIPKEVDAIISSFFLSKIYVIHKNLDEESIIQFLAFAERKIKITATWYILNEMAFILCLTIGLIIAPMLLRWILLKLIPSP
ncbi:hypothetical protein [Neomoorella thermoacetica]|uniref:hypothetical protein n=1 Tax=Neomoorella thermoacetica TaxID=1525 RepID=UPI0008FB801F|nr:hypothetical protein [Moorella thermoacetica]APC08588.1 hypothetical protein MTJW_14290 [Moorella thermoacetica]